MHSPESTTGLQHVFKGTYVSASNNKIGINRELTVDLCGAISDVSIPFFMYPYREEVGIHVNYLCSQKAFMQVTVNPISGYTCAINLSEFFLRVFFSSIFVGAQIYLMLCRFPHGGSIN